MAKSSALALTGDVEGICTNTLVPCLLANIFGEIGVDTKTAFNLTLP